MNLYTVACFTLHSYSEQKVNFLTITFLEITMKCETDSGVKCYKMVFAQTDVKYVFLESQ